MADSKTTQVVHVDVDYSAEGNPLSIYRPVKLMFEMDDRRDPEQWSSGAVRIRRYPGSSFIFNPGGLGGGPVSPEYMGYTYAVTEGDLQETMEVRERYVSGSISLTGALEAELPYPVGRDLIISVDGNLFSPNGNVSYPTIRFISSQQKLYISRPVYGRLTFSYYTNYTIMRYFPTKYAGSEVYFEVSPDNYGELMAFPRGAPSGESPSVITFQIQPPPAVSGEFEIYRVVSTGIINDKGSWEKPSGWPTTGTFVGKTAPDAIEIGASFMEVERAHIVGYLRIGDNNAINSQFASRESVLATPLASQISSDGGSAVNYTLSVGREVANANEYLKRGIKGISRAAIREVTYDIPWAKPYELDVPEVYVVVYCTQANGVTITNSQAIQYKRLLTVKASKPPMASIAQSTREFINSITYDDQAARVNDYLTQAYAMIDWRAIRQAIPQRFNPNVYGAITFDSSVPAS